MCIYFRLIFISGMWLLVFCLVHCSFVHVTDKPIHTLQSNFQLNYVVCHVIGKQKLQIY